MLKGLIGIKVEAYIDDMAIKTASHPNHSKDIHGIFDQLSQYHIGLNPAKCAFGL